MDIVEKILDGWNSSLCSRIELGELISRNPTAHKWKANYRSIVLRELTFWRVTDLLTQIVYLSKNGHLLGSRILLRSTIETIGVLIFLNQKTKAVLNGDETFYNFSKLTTQLMLGSKNKTTPIEAINVTYTILQKWCERKYPGMFNIYEELCETAHPNYEGVCLGYSIIDEVTYVTTFQNRWSELYKSGLEDLTIELIKIFEEEYNEVWPAEFKKLEDWLVKNNEKLEAEKSNH